MAVPRQTASGEGPGSCLNKRFIDRGTSLLSSLRPVVVARITAGIWLLHLEATTNANQTAIVRLEASSAERDAKRSKDQADQNARVDRIEENRTTNLQRLATVEEAVKGQKEILQDIRSKLDRALMGSRGH